MTHSYVHRRADLQCARFWRARTEWPQNLSRLTCMQQSVAACCSVLVLHWVALGCSELQWVAVCRSVLRLVAVSALAGKRICRLLEFCVHYTHCTSLQHTATRWNAPQHTATHCNTQHTTATHDNTRVNLPCAQVLRPLHSLQLTAPHCNTLQLTATLRNTRRHTVVLCKSLQHTARGESICRVLEFRGHYAHCNSMHLTATHCNSLQHSATHGNTLHHFMRLNATQCSTLQHTATLRNTLQHTATRCDTLQLTATHCNRRVNLPCARVLRPQSVTH